MLMSTPSPSTPIKEASVTTGGSIVADPLPLEAPVQIKLPEKDGIPCRRSLQPADIFTGDHDDANLSQLPLAPKSSCAAVLCLGSASG